MATTTSPIKLESNRGARFSNTAHAKFHQTQYDLISKADLPKINVSPDMLKEWKDAIEVEVEITRQAQASVITKEMLVKDRERDEALNNLFGIIRAQRYSHVEPVRKAAEKLSVELKPYFGIQKEINEDETELIRGMEKDATRLVPEIAVLGLTDVMQHLHTVNEEYERLIVTRRNDGDALNLPDTRVARQTSERIFEAICQCIQASYLLSTVDADRKMITTLVTGINHISSDFRDTHAQSQAQKAAAKKRKEGDDSGKKPGDGKKPDDGKKPSDPKKPDDPKKPEDPQKPGGDTPKPGREEDPGEDQV